VFRKTNEAKHFTIIDGAMNDLMRPALYGSFHPMWPVAGGTGAHGLISTRATITTDVVGPICETGDFLGRDRTLPELARGELLAIGAAGAYGAVMSSNYNTRPRAPEILVAGTNYTIVRKRETLEQLIANEVVAG
jgi:diaminopimelate decarboxylase